MPCDIDFKVGDAGLLVWFGGDVAADNRLLVIARLQEIPNDLPDVHVDMSEISAVDSIGVATLVSWLRWMVAGGSKVRVRRAPQMLAHTLYKVGQLTGSGVIELEDPRVETAYTG